MSVPVGIETVGDATVGDPLMPENSRVMFFYHWSFHRKTLFLWMISSTRAGVPVGPSRRRVPNLPTSPSPPECELHMG